MTEMKTVSRVKGPENRQELVQTRRRRKELFKKKGFEFRVKLLRVQGKNRRRIVAVPSDGSAESRRSSFGREFQSTGAWWVKDLSV